MLRVRIPLFLCLVSAVFGQSKAPFDVQAMLKLARVQDPQISPDGRWVAFTVQKVELDANRKTRQIYVVPLEGGSARQITQAGDQNDRPRWAPDSRSLAFVSDRSGSNQIWTMDPNGGNARQVTTIATGAEGVLVSPDGKNLVFSSEVYPDCADEACNKQKLEEEKNSKVKARSYTSLLYRHWDHWQGARRKHLFVVPVSGGTPKDLTPGPRDVPPFDLGGADGYAISPDGTELCFEMDSDPEPAISTNTDLYAVPMAGGEMRKVTVNPGADKSPAYSPDGKYLAYRTQSRAGYESDRWRLVVLDRTSGKLASLTESLDRWVTEFQWYPDSSRLFFVVEDRGRHNLQMVSAGGGGVRTIIAGSTSVAEIQFSRDGKNMVYSQDSGSQPPELFRAASAGGMPVQLTHLNDGVLSGYQLIRLEEFWVEGAGGTQVHSFLVKPAGFDANKKYPVLFLIHGGPQGAWGEKWSYRWNPQVFAAAGFVVVMPNPRGSTGYGQKFTDEINADWGGKPYDDIMAVVDHVADLPYADSNRFAAAGGSYGGYMVNWLLGHTQRFKALVSHAGPFDLRSKFGETEELWFPLWEFGGAPWDNAETYAKWSPSSYVKEFRTPTLIIHGEQDFRVPFGQALQMFTALQMQKIPSKLLLFPDEGHWINKPQNSVLWYKSFLEWIEEWTKKPYVPPVTIIAPGQPQMQEPGK